jgi:hypothetical protein
MHMNGSSSVHRKRNHHMTTSTQPNGAVIYRGPSMLDGAPIVVIVTGLGKGSTNAKTGSLLQTWILRDDVSPVDAIHSGQDASICGACPHRGTVENGRNVGRSCYVAVFQAPRNVWQSERRGLYPTLTPDEARAAFVGKKVRLGAYGDPVAVPLDLWETVLTDADAFTGYTHQWRTCAPAFARLVMASCDSQADYIDAKAAGYRTFRVRTANEVRNTREVVCPASKEAGKKTTCAACLACGGHDSKAKADITIISHGTAGHMNAFKLRADPAQPMPAIIRDQPLALAA